jgi:hypothetical protein
MNKVNQALLIAVSTLTVFFGMGAISYADCSSPATAKEAAQCGTNTASGQTGTAKQASDSINNTIAAALNILSVAGGIVAVVMLIIGGFRYVTSGGDSGKISSAKNTITFAIIGLVVVLFAQALVKFVLQKAT